MYLRQLDYIQFTNLLEFVRKPLLKSLLTGPYSGSVGMEEGGADQHVTHFGGSSLLWKLMFQLHSWWMTWVGYLYE